MNSNTRRTLLKRFVLSVLAGALPAPLRALGSTSPTHSPPSCLIRCLSNQDGARALGMRYLAIAPHEADPLALARLVAGSSRRLLTLAGADVVTLRALLAKQQRSDFAGGRVVNIDGWLLSLTEARICALAALEARLR